MARKRRSSTLVRGARIYIPLEKLVA